MTNRRSLLKSGIALGAAAALPVMGPRHAAAQAARPFTFCSWGGALQETEKKAFVEPFMARKGMRFAEASPTTYAKIKAQVEANAVEWDLVTVGGQWMYQAKDQNLAERMDYSVIRNDDLDKAWKAEYGVYTSTGATVVAFSTRTFPKGGRQPNSWADFWNVKDFPGPRSLYSRMHYNYEAALRAAGVPRDKIYPQTEEKVRLMFQKLEEIKPHVAVWWTSGAQAPQLLSTGEVAMAMAWNGRILDAQKGNAPLEMTLKDGIAWGNAFIVPRGSPYKALAMELINYSITEEAQDRLIPIGTYGPVLEKSAAKATPEQALTMVTHPSNVRDAVIFDDEQSAAYLTKYEAEWQRFQLRR